MERVPGFNCGGSMYAVGAGERGVFRRFRDARRTAERTHESIVRADHSGVGVRYFQVDVHNRTLFECDSNGKRK